MPRLTWLREFGKYLTYRMKRTVLISIVVLSILPGTLLLYLPSTIRWIYAFAFLFLSMIPIFTTVQLITGSVIQLIQIGLYNRKHKPQEINYPEVKQIRKKMGVNHNIQIFVTDNPAVKSPCVNLFSGKITIPSTWIKKHHRSEILAAIGHEFGHIKGYRRFLRGIFLTTFAPVVFILALGLFTLAFGLVFIPIICQIAAFAFMMLVLSYVLWQNEYWADMASAKTVGPEPLIALFESLQKEVKKDDGSETHPPLHERIKRLKSLLDMDN